MKQELWQVRGEAWRDDKLSGNAVKLFLRLTDLFHKNFEHDEEFTFSASHAAKLLGLTHWLSGRKYLAELTSRSYLLPRGLCGCPATFHYAFAEASYRRKPITGSLGKPITGSLGKPITGSLGKPITSSLRKPPIHISNSLREEMKVPMGRNSSLRSKGTKGEGQAPAATGSNGSLRSKLSDEKRRQFAAELAKLSKKMKGGVD